MKPADTLDRIVDAIERATVLDSPAKVGHALLRRVLPPGPIEDAASGTPLGHPVHPLLVAVPIGAWTAASYLDLTGGDARTARRLIGFGNMAAVPAALTGANDWLTTTDAERRVGLVHALLNDVALGLYTASWFARRRGSRMRGAALALAGASVLTASGYLGGHLAYAMGVGVDTTAFEQLPDEWTTVANESDFDERGVATATVDGVAVLLVREADGIHAMADRCTHRGGPLNEGEIKNGEVTCPWHDSRFRISDGCVLSGPATRPQPVAEARIRDGAIQVRRADGG